MEAWKARLVRSWPCVASAALVLLAFPPFNLGLLVFVALVPWLISLRQTNGRQAWKSGYFFGLLMGLGQLYMLGTLAYNWTGSVLVGLLPWLLASFAYGVYFGLTGVLISKCFARGWFWLIPIVWAGVEVFRSYIPVFAFPWGILATPLWPLTPVVQSAHYGMIFLVSAWAVTANLAIAMLMEGEGYRRVRPLFWAFGLVTLLSIYRYSQPETGKKFTVTAGQPGVDLAFGPAKTRNEDLRATIQPILDKADKDGTQLVVLPEGIADARRMPPTTPFVPGKAPLLVGAPRGFEPTYQSALGYERGWKFVDKTRLVIFGEFVPGRDRFPFIAAALKLPTGDMSAGTEGTKSMKIAGITVGPVICFEGLFPDIAYRQALNGSQLLAVISIDDWYLGTMAPDQLRALSIWRAIETGLPLVRSASLGYTLITDGKGRVLAQAPVKEARSLHEELILPERSPMSPAAAAFPVGALAIAIVMLLIPRQRRGGRELQAG
ncbi:MAG: apolipoprotein N-acyltransferase [Fimbriimonas sp.]